MAVGPAGVQWKAWEKMSWLVQMPRARVTGTLTVDGRVVALDLDGARTVFTPDQYDLVHTRWAWDRVNRLFYPSESILTADNGTLRMQVTMRALATEPLRGDLPAPLRDLIIYEQTARYEGTVWGRDDGDEWRVRSLVRGTGFKEWTGKRY